MTDKPNINQADNPKLGCAYFIIYIASFLICFIILKTFGTNTFRPLIPVYYGILLGFIVTAIYYLTLRLKKGSTIFTWSEFEPIWRTFILIILSPLLFYLAWLLIMNNGIVEVTSIVYTDREPFITFLMSGIGILFIILGFIGLNKLQSMILFCVDLFITKLFRSYRIRSK